MKKVLKAAAVLGLVAMTAAPAMAASVDMTGFYRARGYYTNFFKGAAGDFENSKVVIKKDAPTASYVDQRWRGKIAVGDENVKAVVHLELNGLWGQKTNAVDASDPTKKISVGSGADLSGDTIGLAVKNAYLWFKLPETPVDLTVGLQSMSDPYSGFFMGAADVAGVTANVKASENLGLKFGYLVPFAPEITKDQSNTLYIAEAAFAPMKDAKVGANLYFWRDGGDSLGIGGTGQTKIYVPGVNFALNAGPAQLSGFLLGEFGDRKYDNAALAKTKIRGYAADLRVDAAAGPAKVFLEGVYVSGDKPATTNKFEGFAVLDDIDHGSGSSTFNRNDMVLLTPAADSIGTAGAFTYNLSNDGLGALHLAAGAKMDVAPKTTVKLGVGYLAAAKVANNADKGMGTEVNLMVNYNIMKGLDVSGTAAYAFLGDFFTGNTDPYTGAANTASLKDADDPYALIAKVNYAY